MIYLRKSTANADQACLEPYLHAYTTRVNHVKDCRDVLFGVTRVMFWNSTIKDMWTSRELCSMDHLGVLSLIVDGCSISMGIRNLNPTKLEMMKRRLNEKPDQICSQFLTARYVTILVIFGCG
eukprot:TRINITY_DN24186_c0_g1_i1.p2 TRINITY_DN24186_c0_g1~~TRINITY_DN24186_c0_g1_i1.p2  ORF type:complete len:123 (+),score=7.84 TRINITY_DN24186_c0_g1_i1:371-739(+)